MLHIRRNPTVILKPMIVIPAGSIVPENLTIPTIREGTFVEKLNAVQQAPISLVMLSTEELVTLVEKPHLFGLDLIALVGLPGGRYDVTWSSYIAPLKRLTLDTLQGELSRMQSMSDTERKQPDHERLSRPDSTDPFNSSTPEVDEAF